MNNKETGSFYTPNNLVEFMIKYVNINEKKHILEPSAGDGRFLKEILKWNCKSEIKAIDIIEEKVTELKAQYISNGNINVVCADFIEYAKLCEKKFDLIIGNPPYINIKNLNQATIEYSREVFSHMNLEWKMFKNIWVAFIIASIKILSEEGSIFFVLPFEFLQVNYAELLRKYLESVFNVIEIISFEERVFTNIEQEVCLVYMSKKNIEPYIRYSIYNNIIHQQLVSVTNIQRNKPLEKWSNSILDDDEIDFLKESINRHRKIGEIGNISPGIVTGANDFFIFDKTFVEKIENKNIFLPIISKAKDIDEKIIFTEYDFYNNYNNNKKTFLLKTGDINKEMLEKEIYEYIEEGEKLSINKRFKCSKRKFWYNVPLIKSGDVFFFKRYHKIPKIYVNEAEVYTTDMCYNIRLKDEYDKFSVAFCFYNSLTLTLCEFNGRFYGGGVCELTPKEFKALPIPYKKIEKNEIENLETMLKNNVDILVIANYVDSIVFAGENNKEKIKMLMTIRNKFIKRRLKN